MKIWDSTTNQTQYVTNAVGRVPMTVTNARTPRYMVLDAYIAQEAVVQG